MPDEITTSATATNDADQAQGPKEQTGAGPTAESQNTEPGPVPYDRFKIVNDELAALRKWRKEREAEAAKAAKEQDAAEAKRLEEQQEYATLAEKRAAEIEERDAALAELKAQIRDRDLREALRKVAAEQKLAFASPTAEGDAYRALKAEGLLDDLEIENGAAKGLDGLLKTLKEQRGYLFKTPAAMGNIDAAAMSNGQSKTSEQQRQDLIQRFRIK